MSPLASYFIFFAVFMSSNPNFISFIHCQEIEYFILFCYSGIHSDFIRLFIIIIVLCIMQIMLAYDDVLILAGGRFVLF